jgi:hypothetical protein
MAGGSYQAIGQVRLHVAPAEPLPNEMGPLFEHNCVIRRAGLLVITVRGVGDPAALPILLPPLTELVQGKLQDRYCCVSALTATHSQLDY